MLARKSPRPARFLCMSAAKGDMRAWQSQIEIDGNSGIDHILQHARERCWFCIKTVARHADQPA
jgi:hypothetical protein